MKWSIRMGTFAGIDVYVHTTFFILIAWIALAHWQLEQSIGAAAAGVAFILALFGCVVLHEFGHALTARRYGIKTRDITLLPIGGLARLERMPDNPRQELWVALAGPAVNVVIAVTLFAVLQATGTLVPLDSLTLTGGSFLPRLMGVNLLLAAFNMLPAFPMDGGRVLRALLAIRMDYTRATQIAANIGQGMAFSSAWSVSSRTRSSSSSPCSSGSEPVRKRPYPDEICARRDPAGTGDDHRFPGACPD